MNLTDADVLERLRISAAWAHDDNRPLLTSACFDAAREIERLRAALQKIVESSPPDAAYSWCQMRLALCNEIARDALSAEHQSQQQQ